MQNLSFTFTSANEHSPAPSPEFQQWLAEALQPMDLFDRWGDLNPIRSAGRREMLPGLMALREIANRDNADEHFARNAHHTPHAEISELILVLLLLQLEMPDEHRRIGEERNGREQALNDPRLNMQRPLNRHRNISIPPRQPPTPSLSTEEDSPRPSCSVCWGEITGKPVTLNCGTIYDINCLKRMFDANINDEHRFPPRCCGIAVDLRFIKDDLSEETLATYQAKIVEYGTTNRLYCSNARCAQFLGARQKLSSVVSCSSCKSETCARCSSPAHADTVKCKIDPGLVGALKLGDDKGWQRCPNCRQLVERTAGCYHMSCRCGTQFCYICAGRWRSCECNYSRDRIFQRFGLGWMRKKNKRLLDGELGARERGRERIVRLCKRSWENAVKVVSTNVRT